MIPFSPPHIDQKIIDEVTAALKSGWISTGPRTKLFEDKLSAYTGAKAVLCLNSATAGLELMLRWFGVNEGDEVILPAYTYSATANVVVHCGATPVFVDVNADDFNINAANIKAAITKNTKVIMPVDFAGLPCDYDALNAIVNDSSVKAKFVAANEIQKQLGRIMLLSDSAHSFGATYKGKKTGIHADASVFSFHAVKNLTTAEGGAIALNLPESIDNAAVYSALRIKSLHGQTKDALAKMQIGNWRYDIVEAGYKYNMTDIAAAIGLVELERYDSETLIKRKQLCDLYSELFSKYSWAQLPVFTTETQQSCYHLYPLRIKGITEQQRDEIIALIAQHQIAVNVHFIPVPMMSFYKKMGYDVHQYPVTYDNYSREISLPLYFSLTFDQVKMVAQALIQSVEKVLLVNA